MFQKVTKDLSQLPSSILLSNLCSKNRTYPKMNSSYHPISNLNFISKVLERIIYARISSHLESFPSITPFQSAYRQFYSTKTALLCIQNDLLAINKQKVSALVLLDLSATFDLIIKFSCQDCPLFTVSPTQHWIQLLPISWIEHNHFLYSCIPLLPTFSQVYHRVPSSALFSFRCTQALSVKSLQRLQFPIIYMLMTCKFTFHFH